MGRGNGVAGAAALAGIDKAAVLLLALGPETAGAVLRHLGEAEVRQVSQALARLTSIEPGQLADVQQEFQARLTDAGLAIDGRQFARAVVTKALGDAGTGKAAILADLDSPEGAHA